MFAVLGSSKVLGSPLGMLNNMRAGVKVKGKGEEEKGPRGCVGPTCLPTPPHEEVESTTVD